MGVVYAELSMSLDGYIAGPNVSAELPLGERGELLHAWMLDGMSAAEQQTFEEDYFSAVGALIMGRRMVDVGIGPWGDNPTFHAPCFVVTNRPHDTIVKQGGTSYIFVTEGPSAALDWAKAAAGAQNILISGGADVTRQFLNAGLLDQLRLHLVPVVLGSGTPLFAGVSPDIQLTPVDVAIGMRATHLTYTAARRGSSRPSPA